MSRNVLIFVLLSCCFAGSSTSSSDISDFFTDSIGETFGIVPEDYVYNYAIWNECNVPIYSSQQSITSFMGGNFPNADGMSVSNTITSWLNSSAAILVTATDKDAVFSASGQGTAPSVWADAPATLTATGQQLYFNLYIAETSDVMNDPLYLDQIQTLGNKNTSQVYHYHGYTSREWSNGSEVHVPAVELLGYTQVGTDSGDDDDSDVDSTPASTETVTISDSLTSMVFFNNSSTDVQITFTYDSNPLTMILEKNSFNTFNSPDTGVSLRPNTFYFSDVGATTSFISVDFGDVGFDGKTYTMELYGSGSSRSVGIQSLITGSYDLPISDRVRDVSPIACNFWWQNASQSGVSDDQVDNLLDLTGQMWVVYESDDSPIMSKVSRAGGAISWTMLRPEISKGSTYLYFLYIRTTSDDDAEKFIAEFLYGTIGDGVKSLYADDADQDASTNISKMVASLSSTDSSTASLTIDQQVATITGSLDYNLGSMTDASGTIGYLVGADYFSSVGVGSSGQNYTLPPSIYTISSLVSVFEMYVEQTDSLQSSLQQWISEYVDDAAFVEEQVKKLIISANKAAYVSDGELTDVGNVVLQSLLTGPISIQHPSVYMSVVQNQYATTMNSDLPDGMATPEAVANTPMPTYEAPVVA